MNVVVLSPIEVYPPTTGARNRIVSMSRHIAERGHEVTVFSPAKLSINGSRLVKLHAERNLTIFSASLWNPAVLRSILRADLAQFEYPYLLPFMLLLRVIGKSFVLDEHGVEYVFIRELKSMRLDDSLKNRSIGFIIARTPGLVPIALCIEKAALRIASIVFTCSDIDAEQLRRFYKVDPERILVVPNCVDEALPDGVVPHQFGRPTIVFMGSFNHPPNVHAASVLIDEIMPRVRNVVKEVLLVMVGKNPSETLRSEEGEDVLFMGEVKDPRPIVMGADVAVAPIFFGSGTRMKIVDYMMLGRPVVSTSKGAEGLDIEDEVHYLRRDTVSGFSDAVIDLLVHRGRAVLLGQRAQEVARKKYSWNGQIANIIDAYYTVVEDRKS
jgi:glycosyltransferase involved in cell wall biosynthesis